MLNGIMKTLRKLKSLPEQSAAPVQVTHEEIEAMVDAKLKAHEEAMIASGKLGHKEKETDALTEKQIDFALSLLDRLKDDYVLAISPGLLTLQDLNKLIAYRKYRNKGILINLVKKGVLKIR